MWWILAGIVLLIALILFLIAPNRMRRSAPILQEKYFAHRGYHEGSLAPENSLAAFERAAQSGYGIELDVCWTKDEALVVFHDATLKRMCGDERLISDVTLEELRTLRLLDSEEGIPTFEETLRLVAGRVPLLVEIKLTRRVGKLTRKVADVLDGYEGAYMVESFAPQALNALKKFRPDMIRGQLVTGFHRDMRGLALVTSFLLSRLCLNFLSRPDFIAYNKTMESSRILRLMRSFFRLPTAVWTITEQSEMDTANAPANQFIFERFAPRRPQ